jgi:hypothetical protein
MLNIEWTVDNDCSIVRQRDTQPQFVFGFRASFGSRASAFGFDLRLLQTPQPIINAGQPKLVFD